MIDLRLLIGRCNLCLNYRLDVFPRGWCSSEQGFQTLFRQLPPGCILGPPQGFSQVWLEGHMAVPSQLLTLRERETPTVAQSRLRSSSQSHCHDLAAPLPLSSVLVWLNQFLWQALGRILDFWSVAPGRDAEEDYLAFGEGEDTWSGMLLDTIRPCLGTAVTAAVVSIT